MEIIKHGSTNKITSCTFCGCVMKYDFSDIFTIVCNQYITCPECKTTMCVRDWEQEIKEVKDKVNQMKKELNGSDALSEYLQYILED